MTTTTTSTSNPIVDCVSLKGGKIANVTTVMHNSELQFSLKIDRQIVKQAKFKLKTSFLKKDVSLKC